MTKRSHSLLLLFAWIVALMGMGWMLGLLTQAGVSTWYSTMIRSPLTPPNIAFPIAWTILYILIAISGWFIWRQPPSDRIATIKALFVGQMILNWSWTPIFFSFHWVGLAAFVIMVIALLVAAIILLSLRRMKLVSLLMLPYLCWILFASHLTIYILENN